MINKVCLSNYATFTEMVEIIPKKMNFFYGSNGTGKTTISNVIGNYITTPNCNYQFGDANESKVLVYNKSFVEKNFYQSSDLKGIFSLGEDSIEAQDKLRTLREKHRADTEIMMKKRETKEGFTEEIKNNELILIDKCWKAQKNVGDTFSSVFMGCKASKQKFYDNCVDQYKKNSKFDKIDIEKLKEQYNIVYSNKSQLYSKFPIINLDEITNYENSPLLQKVITGSSDTSVGRMIEFLNNSDWVKKGLEYSKLSEGKCPFCQQNMSHELQNEIIAFFDKDYEKSVNELNVFIDNYIKYFSIIKEQLNGISEIEIPLSGIKSIKDQNSLFAAQLDINVSELRKKQESPAHKITIKSCLEILEAINEILKLNNEIIQANNDILNNQEEEEKNCKAAVWQYVLTDLIDDFESHFKFKQGKQKAIENITKQIEDLNSSLSSFEDEIKAIEDTVTSVTPTISEINKILSKFDFKGFHLKENDTKKGTYLILREDGSDAKNTLSEGEYNFITFLYFYYLVYGSQEKTGITSDKIIVIDDPISSLDSNVLFIVSTLVKKIVEDCRENREGIIQTFVLTHNIYFHKEVTFRVDRCKSAKNEVLFGIIRKRDNISSFCTCEKNPIESSYQLLWSELKSDNMSTVTSFNTMRRILEYYFTIIGNVDYGECINKFDGNDKLVCKSLVSCINDGSHFISDDYVMTFDLDNLENYKEIFKMIFEKLGHLQHYNMMMGIENT